MKEANYWIQSLDLQPHPEGGYFRETYRSAGMIDQHCLPPMFSGNRHYSTAIYYLLEKEQFSALHTIRQDEMWHFYAGSPLEIHCISPQGNYQKLRLGSPHHGGHFQVNIPAGDYFGACLTDTSSYALVGCTVSPGFDFEDFELPTQNQLLSLFPQHKTVIEKLTR